MKKRLAKVAVLSLALGSAFCALYALYYFTGLGIPCPVYAFTGRMCPACGTFRMLMALSRLDIKAAAGYNIVMLSLLPALFAFFAFYTVRYVREGTKQLNKAQTVLAVIIIAPLIIFGFIRFFS